jgi:hypothetical protein
MVMCERLVLLSGVDNAALHRSSAPASGTRHCSGNFICRFVSDAISELLKDAGRFAISLDRQDDGLSFGAVANITVAWHAPMLI